MAYLFAPRVAYKPANGGPAARPNRTIADPDTRRVPAPTAPGGSGRPTRRFGGLTLERRSRSWPTSLACLEAARFGACVSPAVLQSTALVLLAALALAGVARVPVFADEADNVLGACMTSRGALIYRDFFSHHFPLPYYALAVLGEPGACSVVAGRALGGGMLLLAGVAFAWIARIRLALPALLALALASPAYYLQLYLAETFVAAGLILVLGLLTERGRRLRGPVGHTVRFLALFTLAWSSPIGLMMTGATMPLLVAGAPGARRAVLVDCAAALLVFPLVLLAQGTLAPFFEQAVLFNVQTYSKYLSVELGNPLALLWETLSFVRHRFSFVVDGAIGQETKATVATFTVFLELALFIGLVASVARARGDRLFRVAVCVLLPLTVARDGFHLSPFVALACFGGAYLLYSARAFSHSGIADSSLSVAATVVSNARDDTTAGPPAAVALPGGIPALAALVAGTVVMVLALRVYFFFLPLQLGAADELAASLLPDPRISRAAGPEDAVLYLPIAPHGYLAQERSPGSFYTFFLPWQADIPGAEERVIADIEAHRVGVIYMDQETQIWGKYRLREYAPRLHAYILRAYRPVDSRDPKRARIFVPADARP